MPYMGSNKHKGFGTWGLMDFLKVVVFGGVSQIKTGHNLFEFPIFYMYSNEFCITKSHEWDWLFWVFMWGLEFCGYLLMANTSFLENWQGGLHNKSLAYKVKTHAPQKL
jgi:hypothetical protein